MVRLKVLTFALALIAAVPCGAQTGVQADENAPSSIFRFHAEEPLQAEKRGLTFPVIEYTDQTGARQQRKGIILSQDIAPNTLIGVGLFETAPKTRGYWGDLPPNVAPRRPKKSAAIGLNWRF